MTTSVMCVERSCQSAHALASNLHLRKSFNLLSPATIDVQKMKDNLYVANGFGIDGISEANL